MRRGDSTRFLENIIYHENYFDYNLFKNKRNPPVQQGKDSLQVKVFGINCSPALFGKPRELLSVLEVEEPMNQPIQYGVSYWIYEARKNGVKDYRIYKAIITSRDNFLKEKGLSETDFLLRRKGSEMYSAIIERLEKKFSK